MAIRTHRAKDGTVTFGVLVNRGKKEWVGTYPTKREARQAEAQALANRKPTARRMTVAEWVEKFLARYEGEHKRSSYETVKQRLRPFVAELGDRRLTELTRFEAIEWAERVSARRVTAVVTCLNAAVDAELIDRNPFRGLGPKRKSRGRADQAPPTHEELGSLLDACCVHGEYAPQMRNLITFAAFTGMRPGELFALEWADVDMHAMRIDVRRRLYKGDTDLPKSNKPRRIALTPPARDALLGQPRDGALVFRAKRGGQLSQPALSIYRSACQPKHRSDVTVRSRMLSCYPMHTETAAGHEFLTVAEAADLLGVNHQTVRRKIREGEIPAVQLGGPGSHIRIPRNGLTAWLWSGGTETADAAS
jgi:excisionase family DNA binding protein